MTTLTITRGLPGSGKTTWARQQPGWRINRDDLRAMLRPTWDYGNREHEELCTLAQHAAVRALLANVDVIVDDTFLHPEHVDEMRRLAEYADVEFHIQDFTEVPLDLCITRDSGRFDPVGAEKIRAMYYRYLARAER